MAQIVGFVLALVLAWTSMAAAAGNAETAWAGVPEGQVRLIAGDGTVAAGQPVLLALEVRLQPGWKTYWRYPGETGAAPRFDWASSDNVAAVQVQWPAPSRFSAFGFDSFGYHDNVLLPLVVAARRDGEALSARLHVNYLVCSDICLPADAELALDLPAGPAAASRHRDRIAAAQARVPATGADAPIKFQSATTVAGEERPELEVMLRSDVPLDAPDLMIEAPTPFSFGRPRAEIAPDRRTATLRLPIYGGNSAALAGREITLTLVDGATAAEGRLTVAP